MRCVPDKTLIQETPGWRRCFIRLKANMASTVIVTNFTGYVCIPGKLQAFDASRRNCKEFSPGSTNHAYNGQPR